MSDQLLQRVFGRSEDQNQVSKQGGDRHLDDATGTSSSAAPGDVVGRIARRISRALDDASRRLEEAMAGASSFSNEGDRRVAITLLNRLTHLLPMCEKILDSTEGAKRFMPQCPAYGADAGNHWAHECPTIDQAESDDAIWDYRTGQKLWLSDFQPRRNSKTASKDPYSGQIPACGVCGAGPGTHWPDQCPENPIRDKMIADRVVPVDQQRKSVAQLRKS